MKDRGVAHFEVSHVLSGRVFSQFKSDSAECGFGLQYLAGDVEGLEVVDEVFAVFSSVDGLADPVVVFGRKRDPFGPSEIEDGVDPEAAVEVAMEVRLGHRMDEFFCNFK
jgi:hypothetical protein